MIRADPTRLERMLNRAAERPPLDLKAATHVAAAEARARDRQLDAFLAWVRQHYPADVHLFDDGLALGASAPPPTRDTVTMLKAYAQHLYDAGGSSTRFKTLLLAVQDRAFELRGGLIRPAWRALTKWEKEEPTRPTVPMPRSVFAAFFVTAALLDLTDFAAVLLLGWFAALRPGDMLGVTREHLSFPADRLDDRACLFVALPEHKTKHRAGIGLKHAVIRDAEVIDYLYHCLRTRALAEFVFRGSEPSRTLRRNPSREATFERFFTHVRERLALPGGQGRGFTAGSLRAGRATDLYADGAHVGDISWQLRHDNDKTRAHYIQEAGCAFATASLRPRSRELVEALSPAFRPILRDCPTGFQPLSAGPRCPTAGLESLDD